MWFRLSQFILRNRIAILVVIIGITGVFGYYAATHIEIDNRYGTMLPKDSEPKRNYELLKSSFGASESLLIFGIQTDSLYSLKKFQAWYDLGEKIAAFDAVDSVFSESHLYQLEKNTENKTFYFQKIVQSRPTTQTEVDSLKKIIRGNPFYDGLLYNRETNASLMMCFINESVMKTLKKAEVVFDVEAVADDYESLLGPVRKTGMPHIRVAVGKKLNHELGFFIWLSAVVTSLLLYFFLRSVKIVLVCLSVVGVGIIWSLGTIGFLDFKLSILMILIPPLIIVITIPNCIYLITKYHQEIISHGNKILALSRVIQKIGNATFLTNLTTALGFATFMFTNSDTLFEFGLIASLNVMLIFFLSLALLPIILSYSKIPKNRHLKHLQKQWLAIAVEKLEFLSLNRRKYVYAGALLIAGIAFYGVTLIKTTGNITGDLPQTDPIVTDLQFIQDNFGGAIPFDILLRTKKKNTWHTRLREIEKAQEYLASFHITSKSLSAVDGIKFVSMAYSDNNPEKYEIPSLARLQRMVPYLENSKSASSAKSFLDSTEMITKISCQIRDIGSYEIQAFIDSMSTTMNAIINPMESFLDSSYKQVNKLKGEKKSAAIKRIYSKVPNVQYDVQNLYSAQDENLQDELMMDESKIYSFHTKDGFNDSLKKAIDLYHWDVIYTGTSVVASNGTQYLVTNLISSLCIAVVLIGLVMFLLFRTWQMVLVSVVPNLIPLVVTAGTMGYFGIPIKPSTLLVFSIAFGISVDDTIHFLAKFKLELKHHANDLRRCTLVALRETGASMIYTSIVLFCGFLMFTFSEFGGTKSLGILISLTLLVAMFSNLIVLPSLLLWLARRVSKKAFAEPLVQLYDEEEDIELEELEIQKTLDKYPDSESGEVNQSGNS